MKLRDYQEQALEAEDRHRAEHPEETRLAMVLATGLGKTVIAAERARRFLADDEGPMGDSDQFYGGPRRVLIIVHTDELAQQAEAKLKLFAGSRWAVGVVKAERDEVDADIVIGSRQTLASWERRSRLVDVGYIIIDECHHALPDNTYGEILRHYGALPTTAEYEANRHDAMGWITPVLGLTATLERGDGASLGGIWQDVVFTRDISWAVRHGHLVEPIGRRIEIDPGAYRVRTSGDVHEAVDAQFSRDPAMLDAQLADGIAPERVVEKWIEHAIRPSLCQECRDAMDSLPEGETTLPAYCPNQGCLTASAEPWSSTVLFAPLVRSAQAFCAAFQRAGISATVVHGDMPKEQRRSILKRYETGKIEVICNAMVLTEGWDSPRTECVIIARPTQSRQLAIQMAGRGLRPDPLRPREDQSCLLLFVADATTDMCTVADLSDKPLDRKAEGRLTAMEDEFDIGKAFQDEARHWTGKVSTVEFDPLVRHSSKVWRTTRGGTPFLPIGKDGRYVFIVGTSVFLRERHALTGGPFKTSRLHQDLPDLELALQVAEDEATDCGGDVGRLLADRNRPWRKEVPAEDSKMVQYGIRLGLGEEIMRILNARPGGKAGKISDLISRVEATRAIDPLVERIKEKVGA